LDLVVPGRVDLRISVELVAEVENVKSVHLEHNRSIVLEGEGFGQTQVHIVEIPITLLAGLRRI
jgi:hypothetical protein